MVLGCRFQYGGVLLLVLLTSIHTFTIKNFCKLPNGGPGRCISAIFCPSISNDSMIPCEDIEEVCCPAMERIVTPIGSANTASPIILTPAPIVPITNPAEPIIELTTKMSPVSQPSPSTNNMAATKCEEYKHRVIKRSSIITYVFGGTESLGKEFPHMAALGYGQIQKIDWLCGGSLISDQFVITAAHCLINSNLGELVRVRLGDVDLHSIFEDAQPQDFGIAQTIIHPEYNLPAQYNDIALLRLDRPVIFTDYIAPICLQINRELTNRNFIATGWGRTETGGAQSDILMQVNLDYFPNDVCRTNYQMVATQTLPRGIDDELQLCAGSYQEEKDTCQGDSGGPLQVRDETGAFYLVGITSFGKACGVANSPAVYTRVSHYVPWIEQLVW